MYALSLLKTASFGRFALSSNSHKFKREYTRTAKISIHINKL